MSDPACPVPRGSGHGGACHTQLAPPRAPTLRASCTGRGRSASVTGLSSGVPRVFKDLRTERTCWFATRQQTKSTRSTNRVCEHPPARVRQQPHDGLSAVPALLDGLEAAVRRRAAFVSSLRLQRLRFAACVRGRYRRRVSDTELEARFA